MEKVTVAESVQEILKVLDTRGYKDNSLYFKQVCFNYIERWFRSHGATCYDSELAKEYELEITHRHISGRMGRGRMIAFLNAMAYIKEYAEQGTVSPGKRLCPILLSGYYQKILERLKHNTAWTEGVRRNVIYATHTYFRWLHENGIETLSLLDENVVRRYILCCADRMLPSSLNTIRRNLKHLHLFLYKEGLLNSDYTDILSFTTPPMHRIQKPVPNDEIAAVLSSIDRNTATGKRNYAMILLAAVTGLRGIDIQKLTFSDIDWVNGEIHVRQSKTENMLALPLTTDVGQAIQDYILHGRPDSALPNIFLTAKSPHVAFTSRGLYSAFNATRKKIGLPPCPSHGLRRAVGTNLVIAGIPVSTVAQVLGHSDLSATKQYISLDSAHLKQCALDFSKLPKRRDGE